MSPRVEWSPFVVISILIDASKGFEVSLKGIGLEMLDRTMGLMEISSSSGMRYKCGVVVIGVVVASGTIVIVCQVVACDGYKDGQQ